MQKTEARIFPALLRHWRTRRGLSQLDLALSADVSSRHVSFLETGRSQPSREMILRLASTLSVPLRDQNALLEAAGYPAEFDEPSVLDGLPPAIEQAIARMMAQQEPYPLTVLDRRYNVVRANAAALRLIPLFVADPSAIAGGINAYRLLFDRKLARDFILDWQSVAHAFISRLHREALARPEDDGLSDLLASILALDDIPASFRYPDFSSPSEPTLTVRLRRGDTALSFFTTVTTFNAPQNVTLEELRIESYFPLDDATAAQCSAMASASPPAASGPTG